MKLQELEHRENPAMLDIIGGMLTYSAFSGENNNLMVQFSGGSYGFRDTGNAITLGVGAIAAGWKGSGTDTVTGSGSRVLSITIDAGEGKNIVNVRQLQAGNPTSIIASGTTTINLNSAAPSLIGGTSSILSPVHVSGSGIILNVSGFSTGSSGNIGIGTQSITGLSPHEITWTGTLASLNVRGSNGSRVAESYTIAGPNAAQFALHTNGGNDTVTITANTTGDINLGSGDDTLTVLLGVRLDGSVFGSMGVKTINANKPGFGEITGTHP